MIADVIPALEALRRALKEAVESQEIADICRVAAYAGDLVLQKYIDLVPECEAYEFSIGTRGWAAFGRLLPFNIIN